MITSNKPKIKLHMILTITFYSHNMINMTKSDSQKLMFPLHPHYMNSWWSYNNSLKCKNFFSYYCYSPKSQLFSPYLLLFRTLHMSSISYTHVFSSSSPCSSSSRSSLHRSLTIRWLDEHHRGWRIC